MADRRDVLSLASRGGRRVARPMTEQPPSDPVLIARQAIELLLRLMDALPPLAPIIQEFLDKLSRAGAGVQRGREAPLERGREAPPPAQAVPPAAAPTRGAEGVAETAPTE